MKKDPNQTLSPDEVVQSRAVQIQKPVSQGQKLSPWDAHNKSHTIILRWRQGPGQDIREAFILLPPAKSISTNVYYIPHAGRRSHQGPGGHIGADSSVKLCLHHQWFRGRNRIRHVWAIIRYKRHRHSSLCPDHRYGLRRYRSTCKTERYREQC